MFRMLALSLSLTFMAGTAFGSPPASSKPAASQQLTHTVKLGETLSGLAVYYGCSTQDLQALNGLTDETVVQGMKLAVPWPDVRLRTAPRINVSTHRVIVGETLGNIAKHYDADVRSMRLFNRMSSDRIKVGQRLKIPTIGPALKRVVVKTKVKAGDSLRVIAQRHAMQQRQLKHYNPGTKWAALRVGQTLKVTRFERVVPVANNGVGKPQPLTRTAVKRAAASPAKAAKVPGCTCTCHHGKGGPSAKAAVPVKGKTAAKAALAANGSDDDDFAYKD